MPIFWTSPAFRGSHRFTIRGWHLVNWQWNPQVSARPVDRVQEQLIGGVVRLGRLIGWVLVVLLLQAVGTLQHARLRLLPQHGDDGASGLPRQLNPRRAESSL